VPQQLKGVAHDHHQPSDEIWQRIAVLEADVAHLKGGAVSKTVVDQVLSYLAGLDSNLAGVREDTSQIKAILPDY